MSAFSNALFGVLSGREGWHKRAVWEKGRLIPERDPAMWRLDDYGFLMRYQDHGNRSSPYGWEIDHYPVPKALGGFDTINNVRPLHYRPNATLGGILRNALSK